MIADGIKCDFCNSEMVGKDGKVSEFFMLPPRRFCSEDCQRTFIRRWGIHKNCGGRITLTPEHLKEAGLGVCQKCEEWITIESCEAMALFSDVILTSCPNCGQVKQ